MKRGSTEQYEITSVMRELGTCIELNQKNSNLYHFLAFLKKSWFI
jgi:hypothetical protein